MITWIEKDDKLEAGVLAGVKPECADSSHKLQQLITDAAETDTNQHVDRQHLTRHLAHNICSGILVFYFMHNTLVTFRFSLHAGFLLQFTFSLHRILLSLQV